MSRASIAPSLGHWDAFYKSGAGTLEPSSFAKFCATAVFPKFHVGFENLKILDLGCGNGRDSEFFAEMGYEVMGIDRSAVAIDGARRNSSGTGPEYTRLDAEDLITSPLGFDVLYMRWFIHSITPMTQDKILDWAVECLPDGGLIAIEARSTSDRRMGQGQSLGENAFVDGHYRRFIRPHDLMYAISDRGFHLEHWAEGCKLAPLYGTGMDRDKFDEDPSLIRCVASLTKRTAGQLAKPDQVKRPPIVRKR